MSVLDFPNPGLRPIGSIVQNIVSVVAKKKADRDALIKAHQHAAAFHEALANALEAERDIEDETAEFGHCDNYWTTKYSENIGKAGVALQRMPVRWAAILNTEMPAAK